MEMTEYLFGEYKLLTNKYIAASQQLRQLLPRFAKLPQSEKIPSSKTTKELLHELDKIEEEIEGTVARLRSIRRHLMELL
jgi:hypothetical protein